jgi:hypothetical protein
LRLRCSFCGVVDVEGERGRRSNGDNARPELDADGDIVVGREAAFAEANGQLGIIRTTSERREGEFPTLDLPQPESPRDTIFAM